MDSTARILKKIELICNSRTSCWTCGGQDVCPLHPYCNGGFYDTLTDEELQELADIIDAWEEVPKKTERKDS